MLVGDEPIGDDARDEADQSQNYAGKINAKAGWTPLMIGHHWLPS